MIVGKRIFVTGGAGFIGSAVIGRLVDANQIVVFDNLARNALANRDFRDHPNLKLVVGDVINIREVADAMGGCDLVIHCAGVAGIDTVIQKPVRTMQVNMIGSANVLQAAFEQGGIDRIVCFSTSEVFGQTALGSSETDRTVFGAVGEARWTYAVSKLAEEHLAIAYWKEASLKTVVLRPFNIYGPGQVGEGALKAFVQRALRDEPIQIHGEGTQIRAWCYVDDMVEAIILSLVHPGAVGESFNIGNSRSTETIYGLANTVVRVLGSKSTIEFINKNYVDVELRIPSVLKAREVLGFEAKVGLEEGILRTAEFYRGGG